MENLAIIGTALVIHIFAWFTPGPLFVLIIRNSLLYSRKSGLWTAVGIAIGNTIHINYSVVSITLLISLSSLTITIIKYLGVGYLVYLGIKTILIAVKTSNNIDHSAQQRDISPLRAAQIGFTVNILSPKASLFFASIFGTIISSGAPNWVVVFLWIAMPINSLIMAAVLSYFFTQEKIRSTYGQHQFIFNKLLGLALLVLATLIAIH